MKSSCQDEATCCSHAAKVVIDDDLVPLGQRAPISRLQECRPVKTHSKKLEDSRGANLDSSEETRILILRVPQHMSTNFSFQLLIKRTWFVIGIPALVALLPGLLVMWVALMRPYLTLSLWASASGSNAFRARRESGTCTGSASASTESKRIDNASL